MKVNGQAKSALDLPVWAVINSKRVVNINITYKGAENLVNKLKDLSACIVTSEAASRMSSKFKSGG